VSFFLVTPDLVGKERMTRAVIVCSSYAEGDDQSGLLNALN